MAKLDISKLAARLEELNKGGGNNSNSSYSYLNLSDGRNVLRILPPKGENEFAEEVFVHYGVGKSESNQKGSMVVCPTTKDDNAKCPVCEAAKALRKLKKKDNDKYDKEARAIGRKKRVYYNAISENTNFADFERRVEEKDGKEVVTWWNTVEDKAGSPVQVFASGIGIFKDIIGFIIDPEYGDITDPEDGLDLIITKSGTGFNTKYDTKTKRKNSAIEFEYWEECLNDLTPLSKHKTYDELVDMLQGGSGSSTPADDEDEDEDDTSNNNTTDDSEEEDDDLQDEIQAAIKKRRG
jgi:hypothetical protein